jgi:tetratricopeptide (TPR) repeat protein
LQRRPRTAQDYADAFRELGIDLETLDAAAAASRISKSAICEELIDALDEWIWLKQRFLQDSGAPRATNSGGAAASTVHDLRAVLILADPDPWRNQLRDPAVLSDRKALEALASQPQTAQWRSSTALLLSRALGIVEADDKGLEVLHAAQQRYPSDLALNLELSRRMRSAKRWQEAIGFARAALAANPLHPGLHYHLGRICADAGLPDQALAAYRQAQALGRDAAALHFAIGNALASQGKWAEAEAAHREAILRQPQAFVYRTALASVLRKRGQWDKAVAALEEAVQASPTSEVALSHVARILATSPEAQHRDFERAVELSKAATEIAPGKPKGWESLCAAKYRIDDWSGAIAALNEGKRVRPSEPSGWYFLAMAYWQHGDKERALYWYNWLVQWEQGHQKWIAEHPWLADELDRFGTEAEELIAPAKRRPRAAGELAKRARRLAAQDQWTQASAEFARRFELAPNDLEAGCEHAAALLLAGDHAGYRELCVQLAERGVSLTCLNQPGRRANLLARIYSLAQQSAADAEQAAQWAQQALEVGPTLRWYQHTMGLAHFRAGRLDEAVKYLDRSLNNSPQWSGQPMNWLALALVHHQRGDAAQARQWLDKAAQKIDQDRQENPQALTALGMHTHDWMTCLVLRREAEALLRLAPDANSQISEKLEKDHGP